MRTLAIWMNGALVGTWQIGRGGNHRLQYSTSWLTHLRRRPLSLSLPFTADNLLEGERVSNYFDNLLPDSEAMRRRIGTRFRLKRADTFNLLQAIGRDCVGAVQLLPPDQAPTGFDKLVYRELTEQQVEQHLGTLGDGLGAADAQTDDDFRLSIAGAQEKTALLRLDDARWCLPLGATPTTDILKPQIGITPGRQLDLSQSVENEWLCNQIVRELRLPAARCDMADFGTRRVLVVQRFDRQWQPTGWIARLPQEDFCQASGLPSASKYEANGGPGMAACLQILKGGEDYARDGRVFLCAQLLFWFLAAIDGHAKNFSLFILPDGRYRLTPLYDVLSAWPLIGSGSHQLAYQKTKLAMALRATTAHYRLAEIRRAHWEQLAQRSGIADAWPAMLDMAQRLGPALDAVKSRLPADFPAAVAQHIFDGVREHLTRFNAQVNQTD